MKEKIDPFAFFGLFLAILLLVFPLGRRKSTASNIIVVGVIIVVCILLFLSGYGLWTLIGL